ncbi:MAG: cell division protein FtsL [Acidipropionibacterium sp.]|jgi:uncharacterized protein HemX|nr:cell division protein FtsL [Acidipropionibacterium sp.]
MSAEIATPEGRLRPTGAERRRRPLLSAVPGSRHRMSGLAFAVVVLLVLALGLVAALVLNTTLQSQSAQITEKKAAVESLSHRQAAISSQVDVKRSPTQLEAAAARLGMVPNVAPAFIDLRTGKVIGTPHKVTGTELKGLLDAPVSAGIR